ncbi:MAG: hypothetical protein J2P55_17650, partial [Rhizobiales bacterium]|nr:hypothetical protein [Hyphomicrobiales bacterium]
MRSVAGNGAVRRMGGLGRSTPPRTYPQAALTHRRSAAQGRRLSMSAGEQMADHIAVAQRYRARAAKCELSAKATSSARFGECYRL